MRAGLRACEGACVRVCVCVCVCVQRGWDSFYSSFVRTSPDTPASSRLQILVALTNYELPPPPPPPPTLEPIHNDHHHHVAWIGFARWKPVEHAQASC